MLGTADPPTMRLDLATGLLPALAVVTPILVFDPAGWAVVGPMKWAIVSTLVPASAVAVAWRRPLVVDRLWTFGWVVFLVLGCVAAANGLDAVSAWIGTPDRRFGMWAWVLIALMFAIGQQLGADAVRTVLRGATITSAGVAMAGALEWAGVPLSGISFESGRIGSTMGSPAYLGAALTLLIPITVGHALDQAEGSAWRRAAAMAAPAATLTLIGTGTRAAWIGLLVAAACTAPQWWQIMTRRKRRLVPLIVVVALGLLLTPLPSRIGASFSGDDALATSRIDEWSVAGRVIADHPLLGTGPEGYRISFPANVDADYERSYGRAVMPDRAHNGFLDVAATLGLGGGVLYLVAGAGVLVAAWRARRQSAVLAGMAAGAIAYLVQQQFLFPLAEVEPLFWLVVGALVRATGEGTVFRVRPPKAIPVALVALTTVSLFLGVADVAADHAMARATRDDDRGAADRATTLRPDSFRTWLVAASVAASAGSPEDLELAVDRIGRARAISPGDPRLAELEAGYLTSWALRSGSVAVLDRALAAWEDRLEADPFNARVWLGAGSARLVAGDPIGAEAAFVEAAHLAPLDATPWVSLTRLYIDLGRPAAAADALRRARSLDPAVQGLADLESAIRSIGGEP